MPGPPLIDGRTLRAKYPWASWTDGQLHKIYRGIEYSISTHTMQISLHGRARTKKMRVSSTSFVELERRNGIEMIVNEGLIFQFHSD